MFASAAWSTSPTRAGGAVPVIVTFRPSLTDRLCTRNASLPPIPVFPRSLLASAAAPVSRVVDEGLSARILNPPSGGTKPFSSIRVGHEHVDDHLRFEKWNPEMPAWLWIASWKMAPN